MENMKALNILPALTVEVMARIEEAVKRVTDLR